MLLGVERPFVGAFAPGGPGATLPHRNGKVRTVLPASVWNMCRQTIEIPQELGRSCCFLGNIPAEHRVNNSGLWQLTRLPGSEYNECTEVSPSEGNEVRRDEQ